MSFQEVIPFFQKGFEYTLLDLFQDTKSADALFNDIFSNIAFPKCYCIIFENACASCLELSLVRNFVFFLHPRTLGPL